VDSVLEKMKNHILAEVKKREEEEKQKQEEEKQQEVENLTLDEFEPILEDVSFNESEEIPFYEPNEYGIMPDPFADEELLTEKTYHIKATAEEHEKIKRFLFNLDVAVGIDE